MKNVHDSIYMSVGDQFPTTIYFWLYVNVLSCILFVFLLPNGKERRGVEIIAQVMIDGRETTFRP